MPMTYGSYWDNNIEQDTAYALDGLYSFDSASDGVSFIDYIMNTTHGDIVVTKASCRVSYREKYQVKVEVYD